MSEYIRKSYLPRPRFIAREGIGGGSRQTGAVSSPAAERERVALVLSGGGALGFAHIGVLEVLEQMRVPVDCVVGASMGALVGGTWAAGVSPQTMRQRIVGTDILGLFDDDPPRRVLPQNVRRDDYRALFDFTLGFNDWQVQLPSAAAAGYKFELFLKDMIGDTAAVADLDFDRLVTPFRAVATDLEDGALRVFERGQLSRVLRASMSLPAVIQPAEVDGRIYVDGGLARNLPVDLGRELCGGRVIAVNLGTKPVTREQLTNSIDVALQSIVILTEQNVNRSIDSLDPDDILIEPDLTGFTSSSFRKQAEIIDKGIDAARAAGDRLRALALSAEEYADWQRQRSQRRPAKLTVTSISAKTSAGINREAVLRDIHAEPGKPIEPRQLHDDIVDIFGRGDFSYIGYTLYPDGDETRMEIEARGKPWGPGYLRLGLGAASDFDSPTQWNAIASYRRAWINSLGAEWHTDFQLGYNSLIGTRFIQPLQVRDGAYISPYVEFARDFVQYYRLENRLGDLEVRRARIGIDFGVTGPLGEAAVGPVFGTVNAFPEFGVLNPVIGETHEHEAGFRLLGVYDQLDSFAYPRSGWLGSAGLESMQDGWGAEEDYTRVHGRLLGAVSLGNNTLAGSLEWGGEISDTPGLPPHAAYQLGGPMRLSGLNIDQLTGDEYSLLTLAYYYRYANLPAQLGKGMFVGASLETGRIDDNLMQDSDDWSTGSSLFWGAETALGVAWLGLGYSSLGQQTLYLRIGPQF